MDKTEKKEQKTVEIRQAGGSDAVYGIGMIGAWVYYFKRATTSRERAMAFLKGLVWPALLVYELLVFLEQSAPAPSAEAHEE